MGLFCSFDVINDFGYLEATEEYHIYPDYSAGCDVFVETFLEVARQLVPVDTGYLRSTLQASTDGVYCEAETDCEYAQYVEYGTWCCPAQPYFEPALLAALDAAAPFWDQAVEEAELEEEMLLAEEEEEERMRLSRDGGGRGGGLRSSFFGGSILLSLLTILVIAFIQAIISSIVSDLTGRRHSGDGGLGMPYIPDIIIT